MTMIVVNYIVSDADSIMQVCLIFWIEGVAETWYLVFDLLSLIFDFDFDDFSGSDAGSVFNHVPDPGDLDDSQLPQRGLPDHHLLRCPRLLLWDWGRWSSWSSWFDYCSFWSSELGKAPMSKSIKSQYPTHCGIWVSFLTRLWYVCNLRRRNILLYSP